MLALGYILLFGISRKSVLCCMASLGTVYKCQEPVWAAGFSSCLAKIVLLNKDGFQDWK